MKKMMCLTVMVAFVTLFAGVANAVDLSPSCGYIYNASDATPPGWDAQSEFLFSILGLLVSELPSDYRLSDSEMNGAGDIVGDGMLDYWQYAMVGAALCTSEPTITSKFNANKTAFEGFINGLLPAIDDLNNTSGTPVPQWMLDVSLDVAAWTPAVPNAAITALPGILGNSLTSGLAGDFESLRTTYGSLIGLLMPFSGWFAVMGGLDGGFDLLIDDLLNELGGSLAGFSTDFDNVIAGIDACLADANAGALTTDLAGLRVHMVYMKNIVDTLPLPTLTLLDRSDPLNEDFAALGDYNGDGVTNLDVYNAFKNAPNGRASMVYWTMTPGVTFTGIPVMGFAGLGLMAGAFAMFGARSLRKK